MSWRPLTSAQAGMVLRASVKNAHGQVLLAAGTVLDERSIWILKSWGVRELDLAESAGPDERNESASPEKLRQIREKLAPVFRHQELAHPAIAELLECCAWLEARRTL